MCFIPIFLDILFASSSSSLGNAIESTVTAKAFFHTAFFANKATKELSIPPDMATSILLCLLRFSRISSILFFNILISVLEIHFFFLGKYFAHRVNRNGLVF